MTIYTYTTRYRSYNTLTHYPIKFAIYSFTIPGDLLTIRFQSTIRSSYPLLIRPYETHSPISLLNFPHRTQPFPDHYYIVIPGDPVTISPSTSHESHTSCVYNVRRIDSIIPPILFDSVQSSSSSNSLYRVTTE